MMARDPGHASACKTRPRSQQNEWPHPGPQLPLQMSRADSSLYEVLRSCTCVSPQLLLCYIYVEAPGFPT